eukprot:gb/GECG01004316.1/.p1 GENE.gb/GECG01004316.1/~~gb/GECG01004316.1/.p1  ORF type:complete len:364 (+),score=33.91 gb/GECG01004316.1/:1-1092(+)
MEQSPLGLGGGDLPMDGQQEFNYPRGTDPSLYNNTGGGRGGGRGGRAPRGGAVGAGRATETAPYMGQNRRVYVSNLPFSVSWQDLKDHMRRAGSVAHAKILTDKEGRSKGCGIVEYESPQDAENAIALLHDSFLKGRPMVVREDRDAYEADTMGEVPPAAENGGAAGLAGNPRVYVSNLSYSVKWQDLKDHMRAAGDVKHAKILEGPDGRSKGCGIVEYSSPLDAANAMRSLNDSVLQGRPILVREDREAREAQNAAPHSIPEPTRLYVGNIPFSYAWQNLKDTFKTVGPVAYANVTLDQDGRSKGWGLVEFEDPEDAKAAIAEMNGNVVDGRPIEVRYDVAGGSAQGRPGRRGRGRGRGGRS